MTKYVVLFCAFILLCIGFFSQDLAYEGKVLLSWLGLLLMGFACIMGVVEPTEEE
jgi:hypothetical protein